MAPLWPTVPSSGRRDGGWQEGGTPLAGRAGLDRPAATVTADDNSFSRPPMSGGKTFTRTFSTAGAVAYHCSIHPFMTGTIDVT